MRQHTTHDHFEAFRQMITAAQQIAKTLGVLGATGPLVIHDSIQQTGVRRFRWASVSGQNDRILVTEILGHLRTCTWSVPGSVVLLRSQLLRPLPTAELRATVVGVSIASENVWMSETVVRIDREPIWESIDCPRHRKLIDPIWSYLRYCYTQGAAQPAET